MSTVNVAFCPSLFAAQRRETKSAGLASNTSPGSMAALGSMWPEPMASGLATDPAAVIGWNLLSAEVAVVIMAD
nr:unnamed protein product [Digitaria exilis]